MDVLRRRRRIGRLFTAALIAVSVVAACAEPDHRHAATGVVEAVRADDGQVVVAHDEIPGFMPAMTMSFDAAPELLAGVEPGDTIRFGLETGENTFRIVDLEVTGQVELGPDRLRLGDELVTAQPAPDFELVDQLGEPVALSDYRGKVLLLDFVFTRCPGPCPILTSSHVNVQRALPDDVRAGSRFVSISLDPAWDTPPRMRAYAERRGADLTHWSFLTGPPEDVEAVVRAYGVGTKREDDGQLVHLVVTFLIDPQGRIVKRYIGLEHDPDEILADLTELARAS